MKDARRCSVGLVPEHQVTAPYTKFLESLAASMLVLNMQFVTPKPRKFHRVVNTPGRASWARFLSESAVSQSQPMLFPKDNLWLPLPQLRMNSALIQCSQSPETLS